MIKLFISVTSHALDPLPLSQTVTLARTPSPSSVTYFMDGPKCLNFTSRSTVLSLSSVLNIYEQLCNCKIL